MTVPIRYLSVNGAVEAKKKAKNAVVRHKYGEYKNVLLSDVQLEKLKEKFPYDREKRIEAVDSWVQQKGKGYDDYYAVRALDKARQSAEYSLDFEKNCEWVREKRPLF